MWGGGGGEKGGCEEDWVILSSISLPAGGPAGGPVIDNIFYPYQKQPLLEDNFQ